MFVSRLGVLGGMSMESMKILVSWAIFHANTTCHLLALQVLTRYRLGCLFAVNGIPARHVCGKYDFSGAVVGNRYGLYLWFMCD